MGQGYSHTARRVTVVSTVGSWLYFDCGADRISCWTGSVPGELSKAWPKQAGGGSCLGLGGAGGCCVQRALRGGRYKSLDSGEETRLGVGTGVLGPDCIRVRSPYEAPRSQWGKGGQGRRPGSSGRRTGEEEAAASLGEWPARAQEARTPT